MRREPGRPELIYRTIVAEPLLVVMPSDHRLAAETAVPAVALAEEKFIGMSDTAPALQHVIDDYLRKEGVALQPAHRVDNLAMAMSLIASTRGVALLPAYSRNFIPWSVTSRPLAGEAPTIELVAGYHRANTSTVLEVFLSRLNELGVQA